MIDKVRAKFYVRSIEQFSSPVGARCIKLNVVHKYDLAKTPGICQQTVEENKIFGEASPSGEISMVIHNPPAAAFFEVGKSYYVDFALAPE